MIEDFLRYQAQTSPNPMALEISRAEGSYLFDKSGKKYLDFIAGVSACTLGHGHPAIVEAVTKQLKRYAHVMVYGEFVLEPAVTLTRLLAEMTPALLESVYLVNSGTEAVEGALKLARRVTGRSQIIYADKAYHGNTMGSLSVMGYERRKTPFGPLLPDCRSIRFNDTSQLQEITDKTAAMILETIQGGAGFIEPSTGYLEKVRKRCDEVGCLLILDEIQPGFGRTGKLFGFQHYNCVPDILVMGKGMGGGLPIGAFMASREQMKTLSNDPELGHITTFGGNPVIAAAALATLRELTNSDLIPHALEKEQLFRSLLNHPLIKEVRGRGLMLAMLFESADIASEVIRACKMEGLLLFGLLFESRAVRITPPLTISSSEIEEGYAILAEVLDRIQQKTS